MTDPNVAQAAVLIAALTEQVREMAARLHDVERRVGACRTVGARAMRQSAAELRRDICEANFLISRIQRRFPKASPPPATNEMLDRDSANATAVADDKAGLRQHNRWTGSAQRRDAIV